MTTEPDAESPSLFYRSAWTAYLILAVIGLFWWGHHHGDITLGLFIDPETWWIDLFLGVAAGSVLVALWRLGRCRIEAMREVEVWMLETIGRLDSSEIFALALISGFSEELFFRGAMQSSWGWALALGIFTLLHSGPGRAFRFWTLFAFLAGALFSWLTLFRGSLLPAIVAHIVVNGINMYLLMKDPPLWNTVDT